MIDREILTISQASEFLSIPVATLYWYNTKRRIPHFKMGGGRRVYYRKSELLKWMEQYKIEAQ